MPSPERSRMIVQALQQMEKQFGKGAVVQLGSNTVLQVSVIPTGAISLDVALGVGGLPRGRVVEVFGPESSGKTTIALHAIAQAQAAGERRHSSMPNMPSTRSTHERSAWTRTISSFRSRITASKRWKSPMHWFHRTSSTSSWWIRWPRWCPKRARRGNGR